MRATLMVFKGVCQYLIFLFVVQINIGIVFKSYIFAVQKQVAAVHDLINRFLNPIS